MKKIVSIFLIILSSFILASANSSPYEYGTYLMNYDMTEDLSSPLYWYVYAGRDYLLRCEDVAYRGKYSLKFDAASASAASENSIVLNFATETIENSYRYENNDFFCEVYVKGSESDIEKMKFSCYFTFENDGQINHNVFEKQLLDNGWWRIYANVPGTSVKNFKSLYMSVHYLADGQEEGPVYIDDITVRTIPSRIEIQNSDVYIGESVNLSKMNIKGYSYDGEMKLVLDKKSALWSVSEGDAYIDGDILSYDGQDEASIRVNCEYFGKRYDFVLNFREKFGYEISEYKNEKVTVSVSNNYHNDLPFTVVLALYDGNSLYNVYISKETVEAMQTKEIGLENIHIPHIVDDAKMVVYLIGDKGEFKKVRLP